MSEPSWVHVFEAREPFEAEVVAAALEGAGIPARTATNLAMDEVAISQTAMNVRGVQVHVPAEAAAEAAAVLAELRAGVDDEALSEAALAVPDAGGAGGIEAVREPAGREDDVAKRGPLEAWRLLSTVLAWVLLAQVLVTFCMMIGYLTLRILRAE